MNNIFRISLIASLLFTAGGCDFFQGLEEEENKGPVVARVYDSYLYQTDLEDIIPKGLSADDSTSFVQNYINVWAKNELMIYKAEFNLTEEQKQFEEQIKNYRNDLLKFAYQQKYVDDRLDTTISDAQVKEYYEAHLDNFQLKENILQLRYLSLPKDAPDVDKVSGLFKSNKEEDQKALLDYALSFARSFSLEDTSWISFNEFRQLLPIRTYNQQDFLAQNKFVEMEAEGLVYFAEIKNYKIKDNPSPLIYVEDIIRKTLVNKRRLDLIAELEKNLLSDALKKKEFETYP
ncbi:hypothetical protein [Croceimicrobium hydrocarbonivorans]|uniref:Peptidylprolyl isomerase n=1 Tax=Croceimicrobium hydrocarbonivorans TaxID=2761580 RepID=A0A7H0VE70_9FLAO|nr:hypothetical protein [Croceimicrobium hydrocarbonivorans]QNR24018.1 hypothetical protein H4K34_16840 [Croceimicrobium hydrocarbonivorans]